MVSVTLILTKIPCLIEHRVQMSQTFQVWISAGLSIHGEATYGGDFISIYQSDFLRQLRYQWIYLPYFTLLCWIIHHFQTVRTEPLLLWALNTLQYRKLACYRKAAGTHHTLTFLYKVHRSYLRQTVRPARASHSSSVVCPDRHCPQPVVGWWTSCRATGARFISTLCGLNNHVDG